MPYKLNPPTFAPRGRWCVHRRDAESEHAKRRPSSISDYSPESKRLRGRYRSENFARRESRDSLPHNRRHWPAGVSDPPHEGERPRRGSLSTWEEGEIEGSHSEESSHNAGLHRESNQAGHVDTSQTGIPCAGVSQTGIPRNGSRWRGSWPRGREQRECAYAPRPPPFAGDIRRTARRWEEWEKSPAFCRRAGSVAPFPPKPRRSFESWDEGKDRRSLSASEEPPIAAPLIDDRLVSSHLRGDSRRRPAISAGRRRREGSESNASHRPRRPEELDRRTLITQRYRSTSSSSLSKSKRRPPPARRRRSSPGGSRSLRRPVQNHCQRWDSSEGPSEPRRMSHPSHRRKRSMESPVSPRRPYRQPATFPAESPASSRGGSSVSRGASLVRSAESLRSAESGSEGSPPPVCRRRLPVISPCPDDRRRGSRSSETADDISEISAGVPPKRPASPAVLPPADNLPPTEGGTPLVNTKLPRPPAIVEPTGPSGAIRETHGSGAPAGVESSDRMSPRETQAYSLEAVSASDTQALVYTLEATLPSAAPGDGLPLPSGMPAMSLTPRIPSAPPTALVNSWHLPAEIGKMPVLPPDSRGIVSLRVPKDDMSALEDLSDFEISTPDAAKKKRIAAWRARHKPTSPLDEETTIGYQTPESAPVDLPVDLPVDPAYGTGDTPTSSRRVLSPATPGTYPEGGGSECVVTPVPSVEQRATPRIRTRLQAMREASAALSAPSDAGRRRSVRASRPRGASAGDTGTPRGECAASCHISRRVWVSRNTVGQVVTTPALGNVPLLATKYQAHPKKLLLRRLLAAGDGSWRVSGFLWHLLWVDESIPLRSGKHIVDRWTPPVPHSQRPGGVSCPPPADILPESPLVTESEAPPQVVVNDRLRPVCPKCGLPVQQPATDTPNSITPSQSETGVSSSSGPRVNAGKRPWTEDDVMQLVKMYMRVTAGGTGTGSWSKPLVAAFNSQLPPEQQRSFGSIRSKMRDVLKTKLFSQPQMAQIKQEALGIPTDATGVDCGLGSCFEECRTCAVCAQSFHLSCLSNAEKLVGSSPWHCVDCRDCHFCGSSISEPLRLGLTPFRTKITGSRLSAGALPVSALGRAAGGEEADTESPGVPRGVGSVRFAALLATNQLMAGEAEDITNPDVLDMAAYESAVLCNVCGLTAHGACCPEPIAQLHPTGRWRCNGCVRCSVCRAGATQRLPGGDVTTQWGPGFEQCSSCWMLLKEGKLCSVCGRPVDLPNVAVEACAVCRLQVHTRCDPEFPGAGDPWAYACPCCRSPDLRTRLRQACVSLQVQDVQKEFLYLPPASYVTYWRVVKTCGGYCLDGLEKQININPDFSLADFKEYVRRIANNAKICHMPNSDVWTNAHALYRRCKELIGNLQQMDDVPEASPTEEATEEPAETTFRPNVALISAEGPVVDVDGLLLPAKFDVVRTLETPRELKMMETLMLDTQTNKLPIKIRLHVSGDFWTIQVVDGYGQVLHRLPQQTSALAAVQELLAATSPTGEAPHPPPAAVAGDVMHRMFDLVEGPLGRWITEARTKRNQHTLRLADNLTEMVRRRIHSTSRVPPGPTPLGTMTPCEDPENAKSPFALRETDAVELSAGLDDLLQRQKTREDWFFSTSGRLLECRLKVMPSSIHGMGLFAKVDIRESEPVCEYIGEIVRGSVSELRENWNEFLGREGSCYMFRLDDSRVIDATTAGNMARFINHSCSPNCVCRVVTAGDASTRHIVIFAKTDIAAGDEITYDYQFSLEEESAKIICHCGSESCQGRMN